MASAKSKSRVCERRMRLERAVFVVAARVAQFGGPQRRSRRNGAGGPRPIAETRLIRRPGDFCFGSAIAGVAKRNHRQRSPLPDSPPPPAPRPPPSLRAPPMAIRALTHRSPRAMPQAKPLRGGPTPPAADKRAQERHAHGVAWRDDYAWIRADNWREVLRDPSALPADIRALLEAENAYADEILAPTRALQRQLAREMRARLKEDDSEVPAVRRPLRLLFALPPRRPAPHLLPPAARGRQGDGAASTATSAPAASRSSASPPRAIRPITGNSPGAPTTRAPRCTRFACATSRRAPTSPTASRTPPARWCGRAIRSAFLYVAQDENHRPWRVMLHRLGAAQSEDVGGVRGGRSRPGSSRSRRRGSG